jgi:hypothetical protein
MWTCNRNEVKQVQKSIQEVENPNKPLGYRLEMAISYKQTYYPSVLTCRPGSPILQLFHYKNGNGF